MRSVLSLSALFAALAILMGGCQGEVGRLALAGEAVASDDTTVEGPRVRRVWADAGDYSTVSPDGRFVTFVDWTTGDVAVHDLATGESRRVTDKGTWAENGSWAEEPIFSPDGSEIAFMYGNARAEPWVYELRMIGTDGSDERVIKTYDSADWWADLMDWSPRHGILMEFYENWVEEPALAVLSPDDGGVRVLRRFAEVRPHPHDGRFSPDGRFVAYRLGGELRIIRSDGSGDRSLGVEGEVSTVLGWSSDGTRVLVHARRDEGTGIWHVPLREGRLDGDPVLVKGGVPAATEAGYTSDGFYYLVPVDAPRLYQVSVDLASGRVLSEPRALTSPMDGAGMAPAWSPDGSRLAYVLRDSENRFRLMVRAAEGDEVREVAELAPARNVHNVTWSGDGSAIYLQVNPPQVTYSSLRRVDATTGQMEELVRLGETPSGERPRVVATADGSSALVARDGELALRDLSSGQERVLAEVGFTTNFSISPDGESVAVAAGDWGDHTTLMIVPMDGGEPRVLDERTGPAHLEANQDGLPWTADGRHVLIAASDGETHRIMAYPVAGGDPTALIQVKESGQYPAIHSDGRRLVFQDGQVREELWVLDQLDEMP